MVTVGRAPLAASRPMLPRPLQTVCVCLAGSVRDSIMDDCLPGFLEKRRRTI
jgi:hypothetical protein